MYPSYPLPPTLVSRLNNYDWQPDKLGESGAHTFRLIGGNEPLFLKIADPSLAASLQAEAVRMEWLNGRLPVPQLLHFERTDEGAYLLMTTIPGVNTTHFNHRSDGEKEIAIRLLAEGLQQLHNLPIDDCPFDHRLHRQLEKASQRMRCGLIDEADFDRERVGRKTADLYNELLSTRPSHEDIVFTHGDYCLPNVMVLDNHLSGFIDLGNAGIADPYQDLALCTRSLAYNFGSGWEDKFWSYYGLTSPDVAKLGFYRLLDEFF